MNQSSYFAPVLPVILALSITASHASLPDYDAIVTADAVAGPAPTAMLTNAATFNGTNSLAFNFGTVSGDATFEFIVEGTPSTADGYLAVGSNTLSNLRFEQWNNTGQMGMTQLAVADYLFSPGVPTPVTVTHVTYVWNGSGSMKLYLDGMLAGTNNAVAAAFGMPTGAGRLGANPSNGEGMVGTIYRVTCYNSVLSDADILRHADAFRGIQRPPAIASFTATPPAVAAGAQVTLAWNVTGAQTVTLNGSDVTGQTQSVVTQQTTTSYTLAATNANGTTTATREVPVIQPAGHVVINEFMAENASTLADEDGEFSDWLELYNPTAAPVQLIGYFLTDTAASPQKWALPAASLAAGGYRVVFLSGNDRGPAAGQWHTNFRLSKEGEYLALTGPGGTVQAFAPEYPEQDENVSYGLTGADPALAGFMAQPTPGVANDPSPPRPARVRFSEPSGVLTSPLTVTLTCATPGAQIFHRLNNGPATPVTGPLNIPASTQIKAWAERYGQQSAVTHAAWVKLAANMTTYTSPLPILVIDNFAAGPIPQKGWSGTGAGVQQVPRQTALWLAWDRTGATATPTGSPQFLSQIGIRGRGAFSSAWRQKPYAVEAWDEDSSEEDVSVLGMPAHADWILYFPDPDSNKDPTLLFNTFLYELSNRCGRYAPRFRWVELFLNEDGGDVSLTDRRGVYAVLEKVSRGRRRLDFERLSADGTRGSWITSINRMDAAPETGWPAENGAASPQFFRTAGPNRIQQTTPNNPTVVGDDLPQQSNGFLNFDNPGGYSLSAVQRAAIEGWYRSFEDVLYNNTLWRDPVNGYRRWLDERDFAEYFVFNEISKNGDGMLISMFPWKGDDGRLRMGPAWDYNWSSYYIGGSAMVELRWRRNTIWYTRLFTDPDFMQLYIDRWFAFRRGPMSNAAMSAIVDAQAAEITSAKALLQGIPSAADWTTRLNQMKSWLNQRGDWVDSQYTRPPVLSLPTGIVAAGHEVTLSAPAGTIYRTLDGTDPRAPGGAIAATAAIGNTVTIAADTKVTARAHVAPNWSAPTAGVYVTDAVAATTANLVISEIHYHPAPPTPAETAAGFTNEDDFEWIEVLNTGAQKVSLAGLRLRATDTGEGIDFHFNDATFWSLLPNQRALVVKNVAAFTLRYGAGLPVAGAYSGRLDNDGDTVTLLDASGAVLYTIAYDDECPWPDGADGSGYSLTLVTDGNPALPADWRTSIATGGTPGAGDSAPFQGGDLLTYTLGHHRPAVSITANGLSVRQTLVPGSDSAIVSLELSSDLTAWTSAGVECAHELRPSGGAVVMEWTLPVAARKFLRVKVTAR